MPWTVRKNERIYGHQRTKICEERLLFGSKGEIIHLPAEYVKDDVDVECGTYRLSETDNCID